MDILRLFALPTHNNDWRCIFCNRVSTKFIGKEKLWPPHRDECPIGKALLEIYGSWEVLYQYIENLSQEVSA